MLLTERFDQGRVPRASAATAPSALPTGAVTFCFGDIEGATQLASELRSDYSDVLLAHRSILRDAWTSHHGREIRAEGDSFFVVFASPKRGARRRRGSPARTCRAQLARARVGPRSDGPAHRGGFRNGGRIRRYRGYSNCSHRGSGAWRAGARFRIAPGRSSKTTRRRCIALRDLGEHQLKDFPRPEHIYQLAIDGLPADFPALRSLAATPGSLAQSATPTNLVTQLTRFIGRERELQETKVTSRQRSTAHDLGRGRTRKNTVVDRTCHERLGGIQRRSVVRRARRPHGRIVGAPRRGDGRRGA